MIQYLITDPKHYTSDIDRFSHTLERAYKNHFIDFASFRDKGESRNKVELAKAFLAISKRYKIKKRFISRYIDIAKKLDFDGVHLNSDQYELFQECQESALEVIASCHNLCDVERCASSGIEMVTLSPIFSSPNKEKAKGIGFLEEIIQKTDMKIIALGGIISQKEVAAIERTGAYGWASIRAFL